MNTNAHQWERDHRLLMGNHSRATGGDLSPLIQRTTKTSGIRVHWCLFVVFNCIIPAQVAVSDAEGSVCPAMRTAKERGRESRLRLDLWIMRT